MQDGSRSTPTAVSGDRPRGAGSMDAIVFVLLGITALSVLGHAAVVIVSHFLGRSDVAEASSEVFRVWIPLLSAFLGLALGYHFANRDR